MSWLSAVAGLAGTMWQNQQNQASAEASMNFQREVLQNRNQWAVEDLKKAGLNPILAAGATNSSAAGATAQHENLATSAISSAVQKKQMDLSERQQRNQDNIAESVVALNNAKASKEAAETADYEAKLGADFYGNQSNYYGSSARFNDANISYLSKLGARTDNEIAYLQSEIQTQEKERDLLAEKVRTERTVQGRNAAEAALAKVEQGLIQARTNLTQAQETKTEVETEVARLSGRKGFFSKLGDIGSRVIGRIDSADRWLGRKFGLYKD